MQLDPIKGVIIPNDNLKKKKMRQFIVLSLLFVAMQTIVCQEFQSCESVVSKIRSRGQFPLTDRLRNTKSVVCESRGSEGR